MPANMSTEGLGGDVPRIRSAVLFPAVNCWSARRQAGSPNSVAPEPGPQRIAFSCALVSSARHTFTSVALILTGFVGTRPPIEE
jgi:hypothetical protein